jgi:hypothetical protein
VVVFRNFSVLRQANFAAPLKIVVERCLHLPFGPTNALFVIVTKEVFLADLGLWMSEHEFVVPLGSCAILE